MTLHPPPAATLPAAALRATIVCLAPDLFFATRLVDVVRAQGGTPVMTETPDAFVAAVDQYFPVLAVVDLASEGDWATAIQRCKTRPHTAAVPIIAFGAHVDIATLQQARQAGADHAWARSKFVEELVDLVGNAIRPPVHFPAGWDDALSGDAAAGVAAFNRGEFFAQHEHFEHAWLAEPRPIREMYQGILQVGVAFLQMERGNWNGAVKLFRRGLPRLRSLPPLCQGLRIGEFRSAAETIHAEITALGAQQLGTWRGAFPQLLSADGSLFSLPQSINNE
jgi:CheY-like chemotaxis protein